MKEEPPARKRGTRIPDDFHVTPAMVAWATERVPHVDGRTETEKFVNYWQSRSRDATKVDWVKTWKNWMLNAADRYPMSGGNHTGRPLPESNAPRRIPRDERCPTHPGYRAETCGACRADRLAAEAEARP